MAFARRLLSHIISDAHDDEPRRSPLKAFLLVVAVPAIGAALGALGGGLVAVELLLAAGHGVAHSGAAAGVVLGMGGVCILVGGALGLGLSLTIATLVRGVRFLAGRRPWPWRGSVHLGALVLALAVVFGLDRVARVPADRAADASATVVHLAADALGLVLGLPAAVVGGFVGSWAHRRFVAKRA